MTHWKTYLAPDPELELIKEVVMEATRILKADNDMAAPQVALNRVADLRPVKGRSESGTRGASQPASAATPKCFAMADRPWFRHRPYREQNDG